MRKAIEECAELESRTTRRDCLRILGMLGVGLAASNVLPVASEAKISNGLHQVSKTRPAMGTFVNITVVNASRDKALEAIEKGFSRIEELEKVFSRYSDGTPVSWLNRKGALADVPPELAAVMSKAAYFHIVSNGCFDITVQPLVDLYKNTFAATGKLPSTAQVKEKLELVDADGIRVNKKGISLLKDGMGITLDGIAGGFIVDETANALKRAGVQYALINAGGDIRAIGGNGPNQPWKVGITDPNKRKEYVQVVALNSGAVATSGSYEVCFDKAKTHHHILDTRTGSSPVNTTSVTITAPTTMEADALSTAVFVKGPQEGIQLVNSLKNVEALIMTRGARRFQSSGWKAVS